jgi:methylase of polypeptide subunit release factors
VELLVKPPILIPRPETEELVDRIIRDFKEDVGPKRLSLAMLGAGF